MANHDRRICQQKPTHYPSNRIELNRIFSANCFKIYTHVPCRWNPVCLKFKVDLMFKPQQTGCNEISRLKLPAYILFYYAIMPLFFFTGALSNLPEQIHRSYWQSKILHLINRRYSQYFSFTFTLATGWCGLSRMLNCTIQSYLEQKSSETDTAKAKNIFCLDFTVFSKFVFAAAV